MSKMDYPELPACKVCGSEAGDHAIGCPNRIRFFRLDGHLEDRVYRLWRETSTDVKLSLNKISADPFWIDRETFEKCYAEIPYEDAYGLPCASLNRSQRG